MKECSLQARVYVFGVILIGFALFVMQSLRAIEFPLGILVTALLAGVAQIFKVEGPTERSNYNISWVFYGFSFLLFGAFSAMVVILIAHLIEWLRHKYPWYIQSFNIAVYFIAITAASSLNTIINPDQSSITVLGAAGLLAGIVLFTLINHFLVGMVIKLARGQSFEESGVFEAITLVIDATLLGLGIGSGLIWIVNPFLALLNAVPVYLLHNALRVPALQRKLENLALRKSNICILNPSNITN
jgi:hypothetical protein